MTLLFLANVGLRDVTYQGNPLKPARPEGQALLGRWPKVASDLALPLLQPALDHLRDSGHFPDRVVLCASDQPEGAGPHWESDTLHCAELAKRLLCRRYHLDDSRVAVLRASGRNPALYDEMYDFFRAELARPKVCREATACLVFPVGGTPAANATLLLAAVERFGAASDVLYLREGTASPVRLAVGRQFHLALLRGTLGGQLAHCQFAAAQATLAEMGFGPSSLPWALAEYCRRRLNFDFGGAGAALEGVFTAASPERRPLLDQATDEARALAAGTDEALLLAELVHNTRHTYAAGAYVDFVARLVRLEEIAARLLAEKRLPPLSFQGDDAKSRERRGGQIAAAPALRDYLAAQTVGSQPLRYDETNTVVLLYMLDYLCAEQAAQPPAWQLSEAERQRLAAARDSLRRLEKLNQRRNRATHGFGGMSEEDIEELYGKPPLDLLVDVDRLLELVTGAPRQPWLVEQLRDVVRELAADA